MPDVRLCHAFGCKRQLVDGDFCHVHEPPPVAKAVVIFNAIRAGFGVENIAVANNYRLKDVRAYVAKLRERGDLAKMWPTA